MIPSLGALNRLSVDDERADRLERRLDRLKLGMDDERADRLERLDRLKLGIRRGIKDCV